MKALRYPTDRKLLIVHADDLGAAHSINCASFRALEQGFVTSASAMVPCPWFEEVVEYVRAHPTVDIGFHVTLTSEWKGYRWGPLSPKDAVSSLLDADGYFWQDSRSFTLHAKPEEVEYEVRAQIDYGIRSGICPSHIDCHMAVLWQNPDLFSIYRRVAGKYGIPYRSSPRHEQAAPMELMSIDERERPSFGSWLTKYVSLLRGVKPGITELIVHPGYDDFELRAITKGHEAWGAAWRQLDFDIIGSAEFRYALEVNDIAIVGWTHVRKIQDSF